MAAYLSHLYTLNIAISWGLLILIWLVQIIIYPGFHRIPKADFTQYHRWYVIRISTFVLLLMIGELILAIGWLVLTHFSPYSTASAILVTIVWLSTFMLQVPIHKRLQSGKDNALVNRLVNTNWIRTMAWSTKTVVVTLVALS